MKDLFGKEIEDNSLDKEKIFIKNLIAAFRGEILSHYERKVRNIPDLEKINIF